jgi:hypothetical protein
VWFDRTAEVPEPDGYDHRLAEACGPWADRFRKLGELFEDNHPGEPQGSSRIGVFRHRGSSDHQRDRWHCVM